MSLLNWLATGAKTAVQDVGKGAGAVAHGAENVINQLRPQVAEAPGLPPNMQPQPVTNGPNFHFMANPNAGPGHEKWSFVGGAPPVQMPQVQLPQNNVPNQNWNLYGDRAGNKWYENEDTGERRPYVAPQAPIDSPIPQPIGPFNRQMQLPVQRLMPSLRQPVVESI